MKNNWLFLKFKTGVQSCCGVQVCDATKDNRITKAGNKILVVSEVLTMNKVAVFRKEHFNAAHRLNNPLLSDAENARVFGKCNNPNYHGHNYELIVQVTGLPDAVTGYVIDMKVLSDLIKEQVLDKFDHKNLNLDTTEFASVNPTAENIAIVIYNLLRIKIDAALDLKIRLYETERNFVEYPA